MEKIEKIKFGVLGGGYSNEKNISLKSAKAVNEVFFNEGLKSKLIEIHDKTQLFSKSTYKSLDFVFILIHGAGGEDGELQNFFEEICLNYSGSNSSACEKTFDKNSSKKYLSKEILTPKQYDWDDSKKILIGQDKKTKKIVIKPTKEGSSIGVSIVENDTQQIEEGIREAKKYGQFMIEEFIEGKEITVAMVGEDIFPAVEIIPDDGFYDFNSKYNSKNTSYEKAIFEPSREKELIEYSKTINKDFGCTGWSRIDLIDDGKGFYFLELNTVPGMTDSSLVPKAASFAGVEFNQLVMKIVQSSLDKKDIKM